MSITAAVSGTVTKTFNVATLGLSTVENLFSAGEKLTRSLDVMAEVHLESVQANRDESRLISAQRTQVLNAKLRKDLEREAELLGITL
jgi:hypothetical protein